MFFFRYDLGTEMICILQSKYKLFKGYYLVLNGIDVIKQDDGKIMYLKKADLIFKLLNLGYRPLKSLNEIDISIHYNDGEIVRVVPDV